MHRRYTARSASRKDARLSGRFQDNVGFDMLQDAKMYSYSNAFATAAGQPFTAGPGESVWRQPQVGGGPVFVTEGSAMGASRGARAGAGVGQSQSGRDLGSNRRGLPAEHINFTSL